MTLFVADTHAILWYFTNSHQLGRKASRAFDLAEQGAALIYIPAIVIAELYYLNRKLKSPIDFSRTIRQLESSAQFVLIPFSYQDVRDFDLDQSVPEMHDRMIAGVARRLNAACLTIDPTIKACGFVNVVW